MPGRLFLVQINSENGSALFHAAGQSPGEFLAEILWICDGILQREGLTVVHLQIIA
jgi:hypothetical protein